LDEWHLLIDGQPRCLRYFLAVCYIGMHCRERCCRSAHPATSV